MKKKLSSLVLTALLGFTLACSQNPKPVVGSANQFDSDTYLVLVTTDNIIQSTKAALIANSFPAQFVVKIKLSLNDLIVAYDAADTVYLSYHTAALSGVATAQQQADVSIAIGNVQAKTTLLASAKAGN